MQLKVGSVVLATSGRDRFKFFIVMKIDNNLVYIADGKTRLISNPKRKNIKHIKITKTIFNIDNNVTDKKIKRFLNEYTLDSI